MNKKTKNSIIIVGIVTLSILFGWNYILSDKVDNQGLRSVNKTANPLNIPTDFVTYNGDQIGVSFSYPQDERIQLRTPTNNRIAVIYLGYDQTDGTEIFDGYSIEIHTFEDTRSLLDIVNDDIKSLVGIATVEVGVEPTSLAGKEGYTYTARGLGLFKHQFIKEGKTVAKITTMVADLNDIGYQNEVDLITNSIAF